MTWLMQYYRSTVGKKFVMAITGLILFAYVFFHMLGNLQLYTGSPERINAYAAFLHSTMALPLLWGARVVLLACIFLHVVAAIQLYFQSLGARPVKYRKFRYREADLAARTMILSGPIIAAFLVYHILHLTTGSVLGDTFRHLPNGDPDAYGNVIRGFAMPWVSAFYMAAVALLGLHFYHGLWSWFQTLGWNHPAHNRARRWLSNLLTALVVIGDLSFPVAVLTGLVGKGV